MPIEISKLAAIPYLDLSDLGGRALSSLCFYDGEWKMWTGTADGDLIRIQAWPAESFYFAAAPEQPSDMYFNALSFIAQRASFPEIMKAFGGLQDDVFNLSASLSKLTFLHEQRSSIKHGIQRMAATEVEYILSVCRSMFDLLQEIVAHLWESVHLTDSTLEKKALKQTFRQMVEFAGQLATEADISSRFGIPLPLAHVYAKHAPFFMDLRKVRDNILHRGSQIQTIFCGERGFLIARNLRPFSDWKIWREDEKEPNELVPLLPALSLVVYRTLVAFEEFFTMLDLVITFPKPLVPGMALFMRGHFNSRFLEILDDAAARDQENVQNPLHEHK